MRRRSPRTAGPEQGVGFGRCARGEKRRLGNELAYFADANDVYATLGKMLEEVLDDEELGPKYSRADTVIRWVYTDPDALITVELREGARVRVEYGPTELQPEVTMTMAADVGHRFWLGELNVAVALTRGQIKVSGPADKILRLVPIAVRSFPRYRRLLAERGRSEALPPPSAGATAA